VLLTTTVRGPPAADQGLHAHRRLDCSEDRHPHRMIERLDRNVLTFCCLQCKRDFEPERRALAGAAVDADPAAERFDQLAGDAGAETGSAVAPGDR
jgi:hypothetical protein